MPPTLRVVNRSAATARAPGNHNGGTMNVTSAREPSAKLGAPLVRTCKETLKN